MIHRLVIVLLVLVQAGCATARTAPDRASQAQPANVLFVGNSFTYYNDSLHNHLRRLMRSAEISRDGRIRIMTISGGHLFEHSGLSGMLQTEDWDIVVLQGHSLEAHDPDRLKRFFSAARQHVDAIRKSGAEPLLFMTWAYSGRPEMTQVISNNYHRIGRETGTPVAPVGHAFAQVTRQHPEITLIHEDRRHPTVAGTYLAASVFLGVLYGQSAQGLDYTAGLEPEVARVLQDAAWAVVRGQSKGTE